MYEKVRCVGRENDDEDDSILRRNETRRNPTDARDRLAHRRPRAPRKRRSIKFALSVVPTAPLPSSAYYTSLHTHHHLPCITPTDAADATATVPRPSLRPPPRRWLNRKSPETYVHDGA